MRETTSKNKTRSPRRRLTVLKKNVLNHKEKKVIPFVKIGLLVFVFFVTFSIIDQQMEISEKTKQVEETIEQLRIQNLRNEEMEWMVQNSGSEKNYERIARLELGFVRPDERVFMFIGGD